MIEIRVGDIVKIPAIKLKKCPVCETLKIKYYDYHLHCENKHRFETVYGGVQRITDEHPITLGDHTCPICQSTTFYTIDHHYECEKHHPLEMITITTLKPIPGKIKIGDTVDFGEDGDDVECPICYLEIYFYSPGYYLCKNVHAFQIQKDKSFKRVDDKE